jgi:hypothetical protein
MWQLEPEFFLRDSMTETEFSTFREAKMTLDGFLLK